MEPQSSSERKTEVYEGTLRAGDNIESESDVIIFGDINPGATVVTNGSVFVYGKVRGTLECGKENNTQAVVSCTGFSPIQFSIAGYSLPSDVNVIDLSSTSCYLKLEGQEIKITPFKRD
jgi:septum site-determining protein MinC